MHLAVNDGERGCKSNTVYISVSDHLHMMTLMCPLKWSHDLNSCNYYNKLTIYSKYRLNVDFLTIISFKHKSSNNSL